MSEPRFAYYVEHKGIEKMVGRTFAAVTVGGNAIQVFYHETQPGQHLFKHQAPSGVDRVVLEELRTTATLPVQVWHVEKGARSGLVAPLETVLRHGVPGRYDGRDRLFLPAEFWQFQPITFPVPRWLTKRVLGNEQRVSVSPQLSLL